MRRSSEGDLTLGTSRLNALVRCVRAPDISFWQKFAILQQFSLPVVGNMYVVRANVVMPPWFNGPYREGVFLSHYNKGGVHVPIVNPQVMHQGDPKGEPFFQFRCFNLMGTP